MGAATLRKVAPARKPLFRLFCLMERSRGPTTACVLVEASNSVTVAADAFRILGQSCSPVAAGGGKSHAASMKLPGYLLVPSALAASAAMYTAPVASGPPAAPAPLAMPAFDYQTDWLRLPPDLVMGEIVAVAIDARDHAWVLHRPRTVKDRPSDQIASPIVEFDADGRYVQSFGGPAAGYEWPSSEHTLALGGDGTIWITGNNRNEDHGDDMVLVFRTDRRFVRQFGRKGASGGNYDHQNFNAPADIFVDRKPAEVYVADGYGNQRLIVIDPRTGKFKRMWGAFGSPPPRVAPAAPTGSSQGNGPDSFYGVHGVERSRDGRVYVSDRGNQRVQAFTRKGKYLGQVVIGRDQASPLTASGITFSKDPQQRYLFVADWGNGRIFVVERLALRVIGSIGQAGTAPGEFKGPHLIDTDSKGVIYVAEVQGRRLQRLIPRQTIDAP